MMVWSIRGTGIPREAISTTSLQPYEGTACALLRRLPTGPSYFITILEHAARVVSARVA